MIDFNLSDEQKMLREVAARFVRAGGDLREHRRVAASEDGFRRDRWAELAGLGWLGLCAGERYVGAEGSFVEVAIVLEELGRGLGLEPFLTTAVLGATLIAGADRAAQGDALLDALAAGELRVACAHDEDGASDDPADVSDTVATRQGAAFRLDGRKTMALAAPSAQLLVVSARLADDPGGRFGLFLVEPGAPGVSLSPYPLIDGSRAADVRLAGVAAPAEAMLVGPERALAVLDEAIDRAVLGSVAQAQGCMETMLELTAAHLKTRTQFGRPLGGFQALQHRMAEMFVEVQETRSILWQGLTRIDEGVDARRIAVSAAKACAARAARFVGEQCVQLHGGLGVTDEAAIGHYFKWLVLFERLFGDADHFTDRFARRSGY